MIRIMSLGLLILQIKLISNLKNIIVRKIGKNNTLTIHTQTPIITLTIMLNTNSTSGNSSNMVISLFISYISMYKNSKKCSCSMTQFLLIVFHIKYNYDLYILYEDALNTFFQLFAHQHINYIHLL